MGSSFNMTKSVGGDSKIFLRLAWGKNAHVIGLKFARQFSVVTIVVPSWSLEGQLHKSNTKFNSLRQSVFGFGHYDAQGSTAIP